MYSNALLQGILAVIIFGTLPVSIRFVNVDPFTMGIFRLVMGIVLMLPFAFKQKLNIKRSDWKILFYIGICFGLHWLTNFYAIRISSASIGAIGVATFGVHLLILGAVFLGASFKLLDLVAVLTAVLGCYILVPSFSLKDNNSLGLALSVLSGFLYAILPILHKKLSHISTFNRTFYQLVFALFVFLPFISTTHWSFELKDFLGLLYLGSVCTVLAHYFWVKATTELKPITSSVIYYFNVPISLVLNNLILDESFTAKSYIGVALIIFANVIAFARRNSSYSGEKR